MRVKRAPGLALGLATLVMGLPADANRLTFEVWPDASPDHIVSCSFALTDGWISLVQVTGAGLPAARPMRWHASRAEVEALSSGLQALVGGELGSVNPYVSRQPAAPFLSVTWMTRLDNRLATGLYIQSGLALPVPLSQTLVTLGLGRPCGLTARAVE